MLLLLAAGIALAQAPGDPAPVKNEDGKYFDKDGMPTFKVGNDGTVDWYTFSGYRRYHSECHVCHGPDGEGSTYAPGLKNSAKTMSYADFLDVMVNGRKKVGAARAAGHACLRAQSERHVLSGRYLHLSSGARA